MDPLMLALRVVLALGAVVGVLWFVQKRVSGHQTRTRAGDPLTVVARRGIGAKASVVVLDTGGKRFVLGVTEHAVNILHTDDAPEPDPVPATEPAASAKAFSFAFARATGRTTAEPEVTSESPLGPLRRVELVKTSPVAGSVLSPDTWKQAAAALRKGPVR